MCQTTPSAVGALAVWWGVRRGLGLIHPGVAWLWGVFLAYSLLCLRDLLALAVGLSLLFVLGRYMVARTGQDKMTFAKQELPE